MAYTIYENLQQMLYDLGLSNEIQLQALGHNLKHELHTHFRLVKRGKYLLTYSIIYTTCVHNTNLACSIYSINHYS